MSTTSTGRRALLRRADPTQTTVLRGDFRAAIAARIDALKGTTRETIDANDALRLKGDRSAALAREDVPPAERPEPLEDTTSGSQQATQSAFMQWFAAAVGASVLAEVSAAAVPTGAHYSAAFIRDAYARGARGALREVRQASDGSGPLTVADGGVTLSDSIHRRRLGGLYRSAYNAIRTLADRIRNRVAEALGRGLRRGESKRALADGIGETIDDAAGNTPTNISEWEIPQAYNEGRHAEYSRLGVEEVGVEPEYHVETAGDAAVCARCLALAEAGPYSLEGARGLLPDHNYCRCILSIMT